MRRTLWLFAIALLTFAALLIGRAILLVPAPTSETVPVLDVANDPIQALQRAERLAGAIRIATISHQDPALFDPAAFEQMHAYLEQTFPLTHAQLEREMVAQYSLLYRWRGRDPAKPLYLHEGGAITDGMLPGSTERSPSSASQRRDS